MLGSIIKQQTLKWIIFGLLIAFGIFGLAVGTCLLLKVRNLQKSGIYPPKRLLESEVREPTNLSPIKINLSEKESNSFDDQRDGTDVSDLL